MMLPMNAAPATLSCYYIDQPLDGDELHFVQQALIGPWAKFKTGAHTLAQRRVPLVVPVPQTDGRYAQSRAQRAAQVRVNLRHAGIQADCGRQVLWVAPPDADWDAIFRLAIHEETGVAPYVAQRWRNDAEAAPALRDGIRVIDTTMLLRGL